MSDERGGLLPSEEVVRTALGHLDLDFRAMWAISNLFRTSTAVRRHMESDVLSEHRLSWTSFASALVLWGMGAELEAREFAAAVDSAGPW